MQMTKDDLANLVGLQEQDRILDSLKASIDQVPLDIEALRAESAREKAAVAAVKEQLTQVQLRKKEKELELSQKEEEARKHGRELNAVKTNEAFKALQSEIDKAKAAAGDLETEILLLMEESDKLSREEKAKAGELKTAEAEIGKRISVLDAKKAELEGKHAAEKAKREAMAAAVNAELLSRYEGIRQRRQGVAVSRLDNGTCTVCHMKQPPQILINIAKGIRLTICESCQRILYSPEPAGAKPTPAL